MENSFMKGRRIIFRRKTRVLSLLMVLAMVLGTIVPVQEVKAASDVWDGTVATSFAGGTGTENDPYQIATAEQLALMAEKVNSGDTTYRLSCYELTSDIVLNETLEGTPKEWTAIGTSSNESFNGKFNGNGYTISGLYIEKLEGYQGLFGYASGAVISNVKVEGKVSGEHCVGGIVGNSDSSSIISNCYNDVGVTGSSYVGGIVGSMSSSLISNCYNIGNVIGSSASVGGIVGGNTSSSTISNCYNIGCVTGSGKNVGGIVGCADSAIVHNCCNIGDVTGNSENVGGIAGYIELDSYSSGMNLTRIENCNNGGAVIGEECVAGIIGYAVGTTYYEGNYIYKAKLCVEDCFNSGTIRGSGTGIGGVCGSGQYYTYITCYYNKDLCVLSSSGGRTTKQMVGDSALTNMSLDSTIWEKKPVDKVKKCAYYPNLISVENSACPIYYETNFSVEVNDKDSIYYGKDVEFNIAALYKYDGFAKFAADATAATTYAGEYTVQIDGVTVSEKQKIYDNTESIYVYDKGDLSVGEHTVTVVYDGTNSEYLSDVSATATFEVLPYDVKVNTPVITSTSNTPFTRLQTIAITTDIEDAQIYYTTDGSTPTTASKLYTGEFTIISTTTVKAIAVKQGYKDSDVAEVTFTKKASQTVPECSVFVADDGNDTFTVTIASVEGAEYKFNDGEWGSNNVLENIGHSTTVTAYIRMAESETGFVSDSAMVVKTTGHTELVELEGEPATCTEAGVLTSWYCTICNKLYSDEDGTIEITEDEILIGALGHKWETEWSKDDTHHWHECSNATCPVTNVWLKDGYGEHSYGVWSQVTAPTDTSEGVKVRVCSECEHEETGTIPMFEIVAAPVFAVADGTNFLDEMQVIINTATEGATIYYTTDGSEPTTSGNVYTGEFKITETTTIKAFAAKADMADSEVVTVTYQVRKSQAAVDCNVSTKVQEDNFYTVEIAPVEGAEYKFNDGEWSSSNVIENVGHATEVTAYIRMAAVAEFEVGAEASKTITTAHGVVEKTEGVAASCTENGVLDSWYCASCDKLFGDEAMTVVITADDLVITAPGHNWQSVWSKDETHHWHVCGNENCNVTAAEKMDGYGEHTFGEWSEAKEATETEDGLNIRECSVCEYIEEEVIPATGPKLLVGDFVERMYTVALNRPSDAQGKANWVYVLNEGTHDGAGIAAEFILGEEFEMRGLSDEEYLDVLYHTFFNREPDEGGKELWLAVLASGQSRAFVLSNFVNLLEFSMLCEEYGIERGVMLEDGSAVNPGVSKFVKRMYTTVLGREAENEGLYNNVLALVVGAANAEQIAKNFFTAEEYLMKEKSTASYVTDLYSVFMDRTPDESGLNFWVGCIEDNALTRDDVLGEFAASEEFKAIAASYGLQ